MQQDIIINHLYSVVCHLSSVLCSLSSVFRLLSSAALYICREPSTNQPFLCKTNPILSAVGGLQMNVNPYNTTDYENKPDWTLGESKPNSNPNKPNLRKAKMNINSITTKDYRKKDDFVVRINKPNLVRRRRIAK